MQVSDPNWIGLENIVRHVRNALKEAIADITNVLPEDISLTLSLVASGNLEVTFDVSPPCGDECNNSVVVLAIMETLQQADIVFLLNTKVLEKLPANANFNVDLLTMNTPSTKIQQCSNYIQLFASDEVLFD